MQATTVGYTYRTSTLDMFMDYSVGMALPSWSVAAVNTFLSIFHSKPISADCGHSLGRAPRPQKNNFARLSSREAFPVYPLKRG
jgi:hypothetical protein